MKKKTKEEHFIYHYVIAIERKLDLFGFFAGSKLEKNRSKSTEG